MGWCGMRGGVRVVHCGVSACPQDDYSHALIKLHQTVGRAIEINSAIKFEVFIHKVDGLSDDRKIGTCPM